MCLLQSHPDAVWRTGIQQQLGTNVVPKGSGDLTSPFIWADIVSGLQRFDESGKQITFPNFLVVSSDVHRP